MRALIEAAINPDNTPHGYNWTYAFPMLLFIIIALVLWGLFGRPHHRVPARPLSLGPNSRVSDAGPATAAAVAAGVSLAPGGGTSEAEPAADATDDDPEQPPAGGAGASQ